MLKLNELFLLACSLTDEVVMRFTTLSLGAFLALMVLPGVACPQDETDRTVLGRRASEWMAILRNDKEVRMRRAALIALDRAGPQTRKVFENVGTALREDKEEDVRRAAAIALGRLGAKAVDPDQVFEKIVLTPGIDALALALKQDKSARVRETAATALGGIGKEARGAVGALASALRDMSVEVRASAAEALGNIGPGASEAVPELAQAVRDNKGNPRVRRYAVSALGRIGQEASTSVPALSALLAEPDPTRVSPDEKAAWMELKRVTIVALGLIGDSAAVPALGKALDDAITVRDGKVKNISLSREAITAVNRFGPERKSVLPVLIKAMGDRQDRFVRCQAMNAVGSLGDDLGDQRKVVVAALRQGLTDKLNEVRLASILALGQLGPDLLGTELKAIKSELEQATRSPHKPISEAATAALAKLTRKKT
jgi:HEAT repeat protein